jgi:hypothetical protein
MWRSSRFLPLPFAHLWRALALHFLAALIALPAPGSENTVAGPSAEAFGGSEAARELWAAQAEYDRQRKSPALGFALEIALPSLGNFYAREPEEATLTLTGLLLGGFFLADGYGLLCETFSDSSDCKHKTFSLVQGWIFLIGSRLYGLTSAPMHVARYNRALRARLGLDSAWSAAFVPWLGANKAGFSLALRF